MRSLKFISSLIVLMLITASCCEHKELCYHHPHDHNVEFNVDWSRFGKEVPTGMTVMIFNEDGKSAHNVLSNDIARTTTYLGEGIYNSVVFNQSENEFGTVSFHGLGHMETAEVRALKYKSEWYATKSDAGEGTGDDAAGDQDGDEEGGEGSEEKPAVDSVAYEPEWIGTDLVTDFEVTHEMATSNDTLYNVAQHQPESIVKTLDVRIAVSGIQNFYGARASLTGMAEGYMLGHQRPSDKEATYLLEFWIAYPDEQDPDKGYIKAQVNCFGLPYGHEADPEDNVFDITILLRDNKTQLHYTFPVGDKISFDDDGWADPEVGLDLAIDEPFPDVEQAENLGGGFDAIVNDWGEEIEHDVKM
ncbi:MAG: DUF5119 domain-containing protein [Bacteroidales bacterium]|nr:DUF5119 domain-containing protein [Bacteroidales bacterium]